MTAHMQNFVLRDMNVTQIDAVRVFLLYFCYVDVI